mmetsp:Transcript_27430/g.87907  ORF Transcript_27430/g.87907 Transcript_27430/m.87907 type:complete len:89 (+) Transcript_27430:132-398(+)
MAKVGEGDPRWLVQELGTTNVNNWHWQEKNMMAWSKARLEGLVKGIKAEMSAMEGSAEITGLKDITGEVGPDSRVAAPAPTLPRIVGP